MYRNTSRVKRTTLAMRHTVGARTAQNPRIQWNKNCCVEIHSPVTACFTVWQQNSQSCTKRNFISSMPDKPLAILYRTSSLGKDTWLMTCTCLLDIKWQILPEFFPLFLLQFHPRTRRVDAAVAIDKAMRAIACRCYMSVRRHKWLLGDIRYWTVDQNSRNVERFMPSRRSKMRAPSSRRPECINSFVFHCRMPRICSALVWAKS